MKSLASRLSVVFFACACIVRWVGCRAGADLHLQSLQHELREGANRHRQPYLALQQAWQAQGWWVVNAGECSPSGIPCRMVLLLRQGG